MYGNPAADSAGDSASIKPGVLGGKGEVCEGEAADFLPKVKAGEVAEIGFAGGRLGQNSAVLGLSALLPTVWLRGRRIWSDEDETLDSVRGR